MTSMKLDSADKLTASELAQLWTAYLNDTLSICEVTYFLNHIEDPEIRELLSWSLQLSKAHIEKITTIFKGEQYPIPKGFTLQEDVNVDAPRLYSDSFMLAWLNQFGKLGLNAYSTSVQTATREDVFDYFSECLSESKEVIKQTNTLMLNKGLYNKPPSLPTPEGIDFVHSQQFLAGWFGDIRPITSPEIANLHSNIERNNMGLAALIGYAQTAQSKEVTRYLLRGKEIAEKHIEVFSSVLEENDLPVPKTISSEVTDSTAFTLTDKLMVFKTTVLIGVSLGYYGVSLAGNPRKDIGVDYSRLIAEIAKFAVDGADLLIKKGWLEEPPKAADRDELAKKKDS
ncbi:DUF3231 family protein [Lentibacillus sediminis]|uniref:DUF3231 family protein n=1 Tax=Lentibacillus sediminis TaxID=1940529 RepID=UPI001EFE039B|nr:DUF3231 family protein [Lentibacillus sediminis]